tara:strand:- start:134 stop:439 length:306 start_codon:yes stop_codon:yes gene_type:complete
MKGFSGFGNSSPLKQSRLLKKGKNLYETIKYRLKKSKLLHPPTEFEKMQDYNDARAVKNKGWGDEELYQKYKKKTERRRPNQPKQTIPLPEGTGKPRDTAW